MNCRGSGTSAASGNTPWLPRALERHAVPERLMMVDAALAEEARNGNAAALVKLAKRWWTPLYRVSWNISGRASGLVVEACLQTVSRTEAHLRVVPRTGAEIEPAVNALF